MNFRFGKQTSNTIFRSKEEYQFFVPSLGCPYSLNYFSPTSETRNISQILKNRV